LQLPHKAVGQTIKHGITVIHAACKCGTTAGVSDEWAARPVIGYDSSTI